MNRDNGVQYAPTFAVERGSQRIALEEWVTTEEKRLDTGAFAHAELPRDADDPLTLYAGAGHDECERVFIEPYTGEILGSRPPRADPVSFIIQLHTHLLAGENGDTMVGATMVILIVLAITGVWLW